MIKNELDMNFSMKESSGVNLDSNLSAWAHIVSGAAKKLTSPT